MLAEQPLEGRKWVQEAVVRAMGAVVAGAGYMVVRGLVYFKGMHRSYDLLTGGVAGSFAARALVALVTGDKQRREWAWWGVGIVPFVAAVFAADRMWKLGISVRLAALSALCTCEAGAPGARWVERAVFLLIPLMGAFLHARFFTGGVVTGATVASACLGAAGGMFVLAGAYRRWRRGAG